MIIGIDVGGTNTHGVVLESGRILRKCAVEGNTPSHARKCFNCLSKGIGSKPVRICVTGGNARKLKKSDFGMPFRAVSEIGSIGRGGMHLSKRKNVFVVSMGTGTAFVSVRNGVSMHIGGTGVGGGTIEGLSRIMLSMTPGQAEKAAGKTGSHVDLTVKDIVGRGIGRIPASATAANFGRVSGRPSKAAISSSMLKMIGESVGVASYFAARTVSQEKSMLLCGRVAINGTVKKRILYTIGMFGGRASVPKDAEYCAAIGAALSQ